VLLAGTPTLFQRMYTRKQLGLPEYASPADTQALPGLGNAVAENPLGSLDALISSGANLFMNGTFNGNGRTCASCHRAENNFTIDPAFIATLPADDPLFVAEFNPDLASNFENPALMRRFGLIVENVDGTDDLANKFTMRSVPHTLGMSVSLTPAPGGTDGTSIPPEQRTGWSGDGAPGAGTLRDFATGAVTQHFTRTLARQAGSDFRLPTDAELDAMEAFQLALGRQEDLDLSTLQLSDPVAARGQLLFTQSDSGGGSQGAGKCNVCHANAGANAAFAPANFNFDTGIEAMPDQPARLVDANINSDGGFGKDPHPATPGAFGDGSFNTPPLVEAADTAPYFHNNSVGTLEEAVGFYNSAAFANSPSGQFLASIDSGGVGIQLEPTQVEAIAAFLRTINAMENIRSSTDTAITAKSAANDAGADSLILLMEADIEDAIQVLSARGLSANAVSHLQAALELSADARAQSGLSCRFFLCLPSNGPRNALLNDVIAELNAADAIMRL
jgi:cytochrome c peroxidase